MIYTKGLKKSFGKLNVLNGIDSHIEKGEVVCVIGPSGSGKSTFLRCLNLLEEPRKARSFLRAMILRRPRRISRRYVRKWVWCSSSSTCSTI